MDPMLEAPRELADRALEPLKPLGLPPKPLAPLPLLDGMLRLPILSPPPLPPRLEALGAPDRPPAAPAERSIPPALGAELRDPPCWRALA